LDAVHAIKDLGAHHFLLQLKQAVENQSNTSGRQHHLIAECDLNDVRYLNPPGKGGYNMDSQWCDEFHHALHTLVTDETKGYYSDFGGIGPLIKSFNGAYVYDGIYSPHRHKNFGSKTTGQPGHKFVVFAQNHDQVGNRMLGRRLSSLIGFEMQKISAALFILSPYLPLIFMGEEYGERNPFLYFTSHSDPELIKGIQKGREEEFKDFMNDRKPPSPQSETTWSNSKLTPPAKWSEAQKQILSWYKELILFRKENTLWQGDTRQHFKAKALTDKVMLVTGKRDNQTTRLLYNFGKEPFIYQHQTVKKIFLFSGLSQWGGSINNPNEIKGKNGLLVPPETMVVCSY
jgi:maltooligosyltrehalose trehalohydrolase